MELERNCNQINNRKIREGKNITTIDSKLKYYRLNMYYRIRGAHSISYLNGEEYIDNELKTIDTYVNLIENHIKIEIIR